MRWPWVRKQPEAMPGNSSASVTAAPLDSRCEVCGEYAITLLNGQHVLCWAHYCAEMRKVREGAS